MTAASGTPLADMTSNELRAEVERLDAQLHTAQQSILTAEGMEAAAVIMRKVEYWTGENAAAAIRAEIKT